MVNGPARTPLQAALARWQRAEERSDELTAERALGVLCRRLPWPGPSPRLAEGVLSRARQLGLIRETEGAGRWLWVAGFAFLVGWFVTGWGALAPLLSELVPAQMVASAVAGLASATASLASAVHAAWMQWGWWGRLAAQAMSDLRLIALVTALLSLAVIGAGLLRALLRREDDSALYA